MSKSKKYTQIEILNLVEEPSPAAIINTVRGGIYIFDFLNALKVSPFILKEWAQMLHLSERTIQRYETAKKSFEPLQSERIIEIQKLNLKGVQVLGSTGNYRNWLETPSIGLGGVSPFSLLDSYTGIQLVFSELGRIEHGIFA